MRSLLVIQDDVRSPDVVTGHVELFDPAVLLGVPLEFVVSPELLHPQVGRHYLVLEVLKTENLNISLLTSIMTQGRIIILCYFLLIVINWNIC